MLQKYKLSFDIWGLLLFLIIMIPNFIWFAVPAPNDILRANSITETVDTIENVHKSFYYCRGRLLFVIFFKLDNLL